MSGWSTVPITLVPYITVTLPVNVMGPRPPPSSNLYLRFTIGVKGNLIKFCPRQCWTGGMAQQNNSLILLFNLPWTLIRIKIMVTLIMIINSPDPLWLCLKRIKTFMDNCVLGDYPSRVAHCLVVTLCPAKSICKPIDAFIRPNIDSLADKVTVAEVKNVYRTIQHATSWEIVAQS